jgi:LPXTG-motif cell wall-anchored protein
MFDKIKAFYTEHKDEINGAAFVALGGLLVTGGVLLRRSKRKVDELQTFHDDI